MSGMPRICLITILSLASAMAMAQNSINDTIRIGVISENGHDEPIILLPDFVFNSQLLNPDDRVKRDKLRNDIFVTYPYALTAAAILKDVNANLDKLDT